MAKTKAERPREQRSGKAPAAKSAPAHSRRSEIVRAAARLFRQKGFDATTVRDIADAVGMLSGSLFYHFRSKPEMLRAVIEEGLKRGVERLERAAPASASAEERFRALVRTQFHILHDSDNDFIHVLLYDWRRLPPADQQELIALKDRYDRILQQALAALRAEGQIASDDPMMRLLLFGAINFSVTWYRPDRRLPLDEIAERAADLFLAGPRAP